MGAREENLRPALLAPHERPSAIFASSDTQALGVLEAAATLGLDVPGDVALIGFDDLVETGSIAEARAKGKARIEGKEYVMQDGDVVEFRFNN